MLFLFDVPRIVDGVKIQYNLRHLAIPRIVLGVKVTFSKAFCLSAQCRGCENR